MTAAFEQRPGAEGLVIRRWPAPAPDPTHLLGFGAEEAVVLRSGPGDRALSRWSYGALEPMAHAPSLSAARAALAGWAVPARRDLPPFFSGAVGYMGYDLGWAYAPRPRVPRPDPLGLPHARFALFDAVYARDEHTGEGWLMAQDTPEARRRLDYLQAALRRPTPARRGGLQAGLHAGVSQATHEGRVRELLGLIEAGEVYQVNLTYPLLGRYAGAPEAAFGRLVAGGAPPFAAYLGLGRGQAVVSASPECFLHLDPWAGELATYPIKGTRRRGATPEADAEEAARLEKECFEAAGQEFNLGSPKQLQKVLFEDLGLKIVKRTKTGPSTDASVLEALADDHPLPEAILQYRQVEKLKNTYVDALPKMVSKRTHRVHTLFNQATAATGRLSSHDPNLQNIPIRTELGRELRKVFLAEDGNLLVSVDYSQIELRVLAHFCQDPVLVKAFQENADVHTRTAAALFEIPPEAVTREQRTQAKAVNFGVLYGMGPVRLARDLKIPRRTASQFVKDYFERQPGVRRFIDDTLEDAKKTGQVRTLLGRRRLISDINSRNRGARAAAERIATNTPIQGSAADLIKLAMIRVSGVLQERFPEVKLLLQVHDELLLEAPEAQAQDVAAMVKREMEGIFPLEVP
ncbi:MAG: chorismate-binding protein, partial [Myxococcales bacterium]|nr:chorismate-binding protein [Myxococcales bacterium]